LEGNASVISASRQPFRKNRAIARAALTATTEALPSTKKRIIHSSSTRTKNDISVETYIKFAIEWFEFNVHIN